MIEAETVIGGLMLLSFTGVLWWLIFGIFRNPAERADAWGQLTNGMRSRPLKTLISLAFFAATIAFFTSLVLDVLGLFDPPRGFYLYLPLAAFVLLIGVAFL